MSDWWIINARHEVVKVTERLTEGEEGRWYIEGQPGWFFEWQNLFDNEEDAKLRAIERVLSYALEHGIPVREQYVRTACAYAKELREEIAILRSQIAALHGKVGFAERMARYWYQRFRTFFPEFGKEDEKALPFLAARPEETPQSASTEPYHVFWAMNWYDAGPEVHHECFDTLDEAYQYLAMEGWESWHVKVVQGHPMELDDERLQRMRAGAPDDPRREERERATYLRLKAKYEGENQ